MSAEVLRRAASLMRERAEAARAGRWVAEGEHVLAEWKRGPHHVAECSGSLPVGNDINAEHIASWHPAVALAVADWLDTQADLGHGHGSPAQRKALAVARAYLGSES